MALTRAKLLRWALTANSRSAARGETLHHRAAVVGQMAGIAEDAPVDADRGDRLVVLEGVEEIVDTLVLVQDKEFVGVDEQDPVGAAAFDGVLIGGELRRFVGAQLPCAVGHLAAARQRLQYIGGIVRAVVLVHNDLVESQNAMISDPFLEILSLVFGDKANRTCRGHSHLWLSACADVYPGT
ncbi:MAG: hypothetical protein WDN06_14295 [Asticcacaulis sp.]